MHKCFGTYTCLLKGEMNLILYIRKLLVLLLRLSLKICSILRLVLFSCKIFAVYGTEKLFWM